jgi:hypothetical protein
MSTCFCSSTFAKNGKAAAKHATRSAAKIASAATSAVSRRDGAAGGAVGMGRSFADAGRRR